jgi:hypothetical protein
VSITSLPRIIWALWVLDSFEQHVATVDVHGKRLEILLHGHTCTIEEIVRIPLQQFDAVIVEPLGPSDDAAQIVRVIQSIEALEVFQSEACDDRSATVIPWNFSFVHRRFSGQGWVSTKPGWLFAFDYSGKAAPTKDYVG